MPEHRCRRHRSTLTIEPKGIDMAFHRPSGRQRTFAMLASQLVASMLLLGVLLAFDPSALV